MNFFYIHPFKIRKEAANQPAQARSKNGHDLSEGGEFLDDAIHSEDVQEIPVSYTVESENKIDNR
jgi:hypothetical protein